MNQLLWNPSSDGGAISAEEFSACAQSQCDPCTLCPAPQDAASCGCDCGCDHSCDHGCDHKMVCVCRPICPPKPHPPVTEDGCCCKQSFRAALQLLCSSRIADLVNFNAAAFLTDSYLAGTTQTTAPTTPSTTPSDNLNTPTGSFLRFSPCTCDLLDIDAQVNTPPAASAGITATQVSLCQLAAVVLQAAEGTAEGNLTAAEATTRNFRCLKQLLAQRLTPCNQRCGTCACNCDCEGCCCAAGVLGVLGDNNLSRRVTLAAGTLVVRNVTLLGTLGNVLVLANDTDQRIYFVCATQVQFLA